jgi:hypothetical protein
METPKCYFRTKAQGSPPLLLEWRSTTSRRSHARRRRRRRARPCARASLARHVHWLWHCPTASQVVSDLCALIASWCESHTILYTLGAFREQCALPLVPGPSGSAALVPRVVSLGRWQLTQASRRPHAARSLSHGRREGLFAARRTGTLAAAEPPAAEPEAAEAGRARPVAIEARSSP